MTYRLGTVATVVAFVASFSVSASAQVTGSVAGAVRDGQGGVIPGATVTLVSETRGVKLPSAVTSVNGDFVFVNVTADTYTLEVTMSGFKTAQRKGVAVSPADRVAIPTIALEIGGVTETVDVKGDTPLIQAFTGERSFTVATDSVANLPLADRNFATLATLAPGVDGTARVGGGGATNFMMDGASTMDTGSNRLLVAVNVESIAEVKVLASGYQAEYGRSSGLQITAVTRGGTNRFRGSVYDVERNSDWNSNTKTNKLNGDPKAVTKQREWGYSIGGPVGKPGGRNRLFFFYSHEYQPRTGGKNVVRHRMPTLLERQGDFSQSTDNNGNPYPYIRDTSLTGSCNASSQAACYADGGVVGRIPASKLYQIGLNILNMYPLPTGTAAPGVAYNFEITRPSESLLAYQPAIRLDYQASNSWRATFKMTNWSQRKQTVLGSVPGFNDTRMQNPHVGTMAVTFNYNLNATTFLEGTYGRASNEQAGCALNGNGPNFCTAALPMNPIASKLTAGLGALPALFPDANILNPDYYAYGVLNDVEPPIWDGTRIQLPPGFTWGSRVANAPPNIPYPGFLNVNRTQDVSISLTRVMGRHTIKAGFYNTHSFKAQQRAGWNGTITFSNDSNNPFDSTFGYANAALGVFSSYNQASKYVEGVFIYNNTEGYIQDNWKVTNRLTMDYGVRLVRQQPQYDKLGQASNFLPEEWTTDQAPLLYAAGCAGASPCPASSNRQAMDPRNGQLLGPTSVNSIGTLVPGTGDPTNGLFLSGQGIAKTTYTWPLLALAPRFGMAYDLSGRQTLVLRGGAGLFFDRPDGNAIFPQVQNPPTYKNITVRYGTLQTLGASGLTTEGPPALAVYEYDSKLPSSTQWNAGMQMMLPWATSLDFSYVGHHSFNLLQNVNLNAVDFGSAFLPQNQDPTLSSTTPGAAAVSQDRMRAFRGYGAIQQQWGRGWRTYHSIQFAFNRRFNKGISFGFNDTISLYDHQTTGVRLQHNTDGSYFIRDDQVRADELLGTAVGRVHILKANFVWDLPDISRDGTLRQFLGYVLNDWRLSGIWTGRTGDGYDIGFSYQNGGGSVNLTGSQDYGARVSIAGDPGSGCSTNPYQQFNTSAFQGPPVGSVGLESPDNYMRACFTSILDLSLSRTIRLGAARNVQLRVDVFNAPNAAAITNRNTTMNLQNPSDPVTVTNLPYNANGDLIDSRSRPRGAGFGVATDYQNARTVQLQVRFSF